MKMTPQEAVAKWNDNRREGKNKWVVMQCELTTGYILYLKSFNTWIQVARLYNPGSKNPLYRTVTAATKKLGK